MRKYTIDSKTSILQSLYTFPYLTADRVTKLLFSPGSLQGVRQHLKELSDTKLVHRDLVFSQLRSKEYIYWLATSGRRKLRGLSSSYDFKGWQEPTPMARLITSPHFSHYMATTDFLIASIGISELYPDISIEEATHYFHIRLTTTAPVIPDGLIKIMLPNKKRLYILPEIDLATESDLRIQEKIVNYLPYITSGNFAKEYGIEDVPTIAFYTPYQQRRNKLILIIEKALLSQYEPSKASWFRVGCGDMSPELFFEKIWVTPGGLKERKISSLIL